MAEQQSPLCGNEGKLSPCHFLSSLAQANPLYFPQLQEVMTYPQSVGIVGGRPGSSLYFLGFQGQHLLYLDPHHVQVGCRTDSSQHQHLLSHRWISCLAHTYARSHKRMLARTYLCTRAHLTDALLLGQHTTSPCGSAAVGLLEYAAYLS